jgi:hypothetical protein
VLTYVPTAQTFHDVHALALLVTLNEPEQAAQVRSAVALPSDVTDCPAEQTVFPTQAVAALPSWSHVSPPQSCFGVFPPAQ